ncbi:DUF4190 domain-containing protein [Corynebacterium matruchotii]|uniref:DUF4190 domain-containing protein n=1 Tax=Corynebacterium matruchotii TaxID=43768 RepID=UPI0028D2137A|nr:DUF4190 domain-containing protein [Corynebacterium matruchotii]
MTLPNFPSSGDSGDAGQPGGLPNYDAMPSGPMMGVDDASLAGLKKNTMAVVALVLAIIGLLLCWVPLFGTALLLGALTIAIIALVKAKNYPQLTARRGMSITALIVAVLALILNLVISFLLYYVYSVAPECADISDSLARRQCLEQKLKAN